MFLKFSASGSRLWTLMSIIYSSKQGSGIEVMCVRERETEKEVRLSLNWIIKGGIV